MFYNNGWIIWPINLNNPKVANDIIMAECASPRNAGKRKRYNFRNDIPILTQFLEYDEIDEYSKKYVRGFLNLLRQMRLLDVSPEAMRQASLPGQKQLSDRGEIRQERDPKERYFIPFSKKKDIWIIQPKDVKN